MDFEMQKFLFTYINRMLISIYDRERKLLGFQVLPISFLLAK